MTTALTIKANVKGEEELRGLQKGLNKVAGTSNKTATAFNKLKKASSSLTGVIASLGATAAASGFIKAGVDAQRVEKTIAALAGEYKETGRVMDFAAESAKRFGLGQTETERAVADLFARLRPMGIALEDIEKTFTGVNQAGLRMNLTAHDMDGVLLQLSQALGSGVLQGDEFRSVMERLPAIGQAVAKEMGIAVSQLKEASGDGLLTTEIVIKAMDHLENLKAPPPDSFKLFRQAQLDLATTIGDVLVPVLTPLVQGLTGLIKIFGLIPGPIRTLIVLAGGLVIGITALIVPVGIAVTAFSALGTALAALKGAGLIALISGWVGSIGPLVVAIKGIGVAIAAVFTAPAAPLVLAGLAVAGLVAALIKWRKEIGDFFTGMIDGLKEWSEEVGERWEAIRDKFKEKFVEPALELVKKFKDGTVKAFKGLAESVKAPFLAIWTAIKDVMNLIVQGIVDRINSVADGVNFIIKKINSIASKIKVPAIPLVPTISIPEFAKGGVVEGPTLAMVGEKEQEFIIPKSKMSESAMNWLSGKRGEAVIPAFASGGVVNSGGGYSSANVNISTGPVMQMEGQNYVTVSDLENALQTFSSSIFANSRSYGGRRFQGLS